MAAAAFVGAGALFAFCAVGPVRAIALRAAVAASIAATVGMLGDRPSVLRDLGRRPAARPPLILLVAAAALVLFAGPAVSRVRVGTQQWRRTPFLFVSVRGDLEQPIVLREVRRLTDFLRAQPGIANAWSVADLLFGVAQPGEEVSRIPDSADTVRRLLVQARNDPAVALELAPDHREALVVVRFDDETPADRLALHDRLVSYLQSELRPALVRVDLSDPHVPSVTRSVGRGLLANDAQERIVRICARSGRTLNDAEIAAVERAARQAALVPAADLGRLKAEIIAIVRDLAQEPGAVGLLALGPVERARLGEELGGASGGATLDDTRQALAAHLPAQKGDGDDAGDRLAALAQALHPRLVRARQRHAARINFRAMLYGADLPTEGMLSDEVRSATLDAMGPIVGIPVARDSPSADHLDAVAVGGAANDRALSDYLHPAVRTGLLAGVAALALPARSRAGRSGRSRSRRGGWCEDRGAAPDGGPMGDDDDGGGRGRAVVRGHGRVRLWHRALEHGGAPQRSAVDPFDDPVPFDRAAAPSGARRARGGAHRAGAATAARHRAGPTPDAGGA